MNRRRPSGPPNVQLLAASGSTIRPSSVASGARTWMPSPAEVQMLPVHVDAEPVGDARLDHREDARRARGSVGRRRRTRRCGGCRRGPARSRCRTRTAIVSSGEKASPLGWRIGVRRDGQLPAVAIEPEDEAAAELRVGPVALRVIEDAVGRIGEPDRPVRGDHDVVGRVQPVTLVAIDDGRARAVRLVPGDPPRAVLAGEDRAVAIERVAVGEVRRPVEVAGAGRGVPSAHDVAPDIAPDQRVVRRQVDRSLGPDRAVGEGRDGRAGGDQPIEPRVERRRE